MAASASRYVTSYLLHSQILPHRCHSHHHTFLHFPSNQPNKHPFLAFNLSLEPNMTLLLFFLFLVWASPSHCSPTQLDALMALKLSLDPENRFLTSWTPHSDPCGGALEGVACNQQGHVTNISLQGKGLSGSLPAAVGELKSLTGLYLHFNALSGMIPKEIANLSELTDLYLNVNNLSGDVPRQIGNMSNLQGCSSFSCIFLLLISFSSRNWVFLLFQLPKNSLNFS